MKRLKVARPTITKRIKTLEETVKLLESKIKLLVSRINKFDSGESLWRD